MKQPIDLKLAKLELAKQRESELFGLLKSLMASGAFQVLTTIVLTEVLQHIYLTDSSGRKYQVVTDLTGNALETTMVLKDVLPVVYKAGSELQTLLPLITALKAAG